MSGTSAGEIATVSGCDYDLLLWKYLILQAKQVSQN